MGLIDKIILIAKHQTQECTLETNSNLKGFYKSLHEKTITGDLKGFQVMNEEIRWPGMFPRHLKCKSNSSGN